MTEVIRNIPYRAHSQVAAEKWVHIGVSLMICLPYFNVLLDPLCRNLATGGKTYQSRGVAEGRKFDNLDLNTSRPNLRRLRYVRVCCIRWMVNQTGDRGQRSRNHKCSTPRGFHVTSSGQMSLSSFCYVSSRFAAVMTIHCL